MEGYQNIKFVAAPKKSEWYVTCANVRYYPDEGQEPNWFHRKMQGLILGLKWKKDEKTS